MAELIVKTDQEIQECIATQKALCKEKGWPLFAPDNGNCFRCHKNIYQNYLMDGRISHGKTGKEDISGCPHCWYSFCD